MIQLRRRKTVYPYEEQIARAQRYYDRFEKLNDGMVQDRPSDEYIDDAYAFFQCCYHVKDHLKNDQAFTKHTNAEVETYVTDTPALAICADICNALKHFKLDRKPRSGDQPKFGGRIFSVVVKDVMGGPPQPSEIAIQLSIEHKGAKLDAFEVATEAMKAWTDFI
jgi:hypothetical protein